MQVKVDICFLQSKLDDDVEKEMNRIKSCCSSDSAAQFQQSSPLIVAGLVKRFNRSSSSSSRLCGRTEQVEAVNNLTFGIERGTCFGFLGSNGAGKSTTFRMLTGEIRPSAGTAYINGYDMLGSSSSSSRQSLAFCPQFDYLADFLTVSETLAFYAGLRGLLDEATTIVRDLSRVFELDDGRLAHTQIRSLSGGNKRKVSAAVAFIGNPRLVLLDEPTSGMDPAARRHLWTVIRRACRQAHMTVMLTTHK